MLGDLARLRHIRGTLALVDGDAGSDLTKNWPLMRRMADTLFARATESAKIDRRFIEAVSSVLSDAQPGDGCAESYDKILRLAENVSVSAAPDLAELLRELSDFQIALISRQDPSARRLLRALLEAEAMRFEEMRAVALAKDFASLSEGDKAGGDATIDRARLSSFLRAQRPRENRLEVADVRILAGGYSKTTMLVSLDGCRELPAEVILRKDSEAVHSAGSVANESALLQCLEERGVRVPRLLASDATGETLGSPFIVVSKCGGKIVGDLLRLSSPNPLLCRNVARELARIHDQPISHVRHVLCGPHSASARAWVEKLLEQDYASWAGLGIVDPIYESAYAWLHANIDVLDEAPYGLVHGDYGLQNILVDEDEVSAILDWEFAALGCPAYDLGYFFDQAEALESWGEFCTAYQAERGVAYDPRLLDYFILLTTARFGAMGHRLLKHLDEQKSLDDGLANMAGEFFIETFAGRVTRALTRVLD